MIRLNKEMYSKNALLKAAYSFTDRFYVHLSTDATDYIVSVDPKNDRYELGENEFKNEILAQEVREIVSEQTRDIRTLIMARTFSSSVVDNSINTPALHDNGFELDDILTDWFDKNDNS